MWWYGREKEVWIDPFEEDETETDPDKRIMLFQSQWNTRDQMLDVAEEYFEAMDAGLSRQELVSAVHDPDMINEFCFAARWGELWDNVEFFYARTTGGVLSPADAALLQLKKDRAVSLVQRIDPGRPKGGKNSPSRTGPATVSGGGYRLDLPVIFDFKPRHPVAWRKEK